MTVRITRAAAKLGPAAPVRAVHLGLGAFHRSHQAWYTACAPEWGIAAYTFRNTELPRALTEQEGAYTLRVPGEVDAVEAIGSISRAHAGGEQEQWLRDLASPEVEVLTLTVTEAAYARPEPHRDSAMGRVLAGLRARHRAHGAPITLVPCDNVPANGEVLRSVIRAAAAGDPAFVEWTEAQVGIVSTVVDRITPAPGTDAAEEAARVIGFQDAAPVVAEPFTEWLLSGNFTGERPPWERRGARFVNDIGAYTDRKLWFLNGAHTLLAYAGLAHGHRTIRDAVRDARLAALVQEWWDTAARHINVDTSEIGEYRRNLFMRFAARGIRHELAQIAGDGSQKIPARLLPVLRAERAAGRLPAAVVIGLACWLRHVQTAEVRDPRAAELVEAARSREPVRRTLIALDHDLGTDDDLVSAVAAEHRTPAPKVG
ncbi:mannitol dehydrogenase family protein [Saccharopolyspora dendranthemae]|uniref:Fructuronate reductase n=1 Tax=Saccharopolyspora dendranthemae TaxID=1181886 RepID=A0A561V833_9PSEU|nr:mannitol dehydrogenase family protein [Saccharopolyspora dendranthemae]TWG07776.1 fructuronate reductase [Saccharopolyspora dendranthemae]